MVLPLARLAYLEPEAAHRHLARALGILKPLAAAGRLDAMRVGWIPIIEAQLAAASGAVEAPPPLPANMPVPQNRSWLRRFLRRD